MAVKVVDASAMAALLFGEAEGEQVADLLGESVLAAPSLIRYEIGSVCLKKCRIEPDSADALQVAYGMMAEMGLRLHDPDPAAVLQLALQRGLTFYDASYLWLSETLNVPLVSLDRKVLQAIKRSQTPL